MDIPQYGTKTDLQIMPNINGLVQDYGISSADALEIPQSETNHHHFTVTLNLIIWQYCTQNTNKLTKTAQILP